MNRHPLSLQPGTVVEVAIPFGPITIRHPGIVTDQRGRDGLPTVINASKRRDRTHTEETWTSFTGGGAAVVRHIRSPLSPDERLRRARADLGRPWNLFHANCEHAVARWIGTPETSPQLVTGVLVAALLATAVVVLRR
mgnify:CR=1 FL=1